MKTLTAVVGTRGLTPGDTEHILRSLDVRPALSLTQVNPDMAVRFMQDANMTNH